MSDIIKVSSLGKTWLFDLDGTVLVHNGYKNGGDVLLDGAKAFFDSISYDDKIVFLTSRKIADKEITEKFLSENGIRYDHIIYDLPYGERIIVNDKKNSGLVTAIAVNTNRDEFMKIKFEIDKTL